LLQIIYDKIIAHRAVKMRLPQSIESFSVNLLYSQAFTLMFEEVQTVFATEKELNFYFIISFGCEYMHKHFF